MVVVTMPAATRTVRLFVLVRTDIVYKKIEGHVSILMNAWITTVAAITYVTTQMDISPAPVRTDIIYMKIIGLVPI
jgi:hypothetical protein